MANNHYVSKLILKRFARDISTFNMETNTLVEKDFIKKIFCNDDIYDEDIEKKLADELESPFATLLDNKILKSKEICLTREELYLLKKYLLLDSVRTYDAVDFQRVIENFSKSTEKFLTFPVDHTINWIKHLPKTSDLNLSPRELQMRAMRLFLECGSLEEILISDLATRELCCWAKVIYGAYCNFWDCADNQEFILSSTGMVSEYEPSHLVFEGLDLSKFSYLLYNIQNEGLQDKVKAFYCGQLGFIQLMYENFNIFNLSSTRCVVLCNPYFRLYNDDKLIINGEEVEFEKPCNWPTFFETRSITRVPKNSYKDLLCGITKNDKFTYIPIKLSLNDTIYLNCLILSQTHKLIGFHDVNKIIDSLICANLLNSLNDKCLLTELQGMEALSRWIDNLIKDKYSYIFKYFKDKKWEYAIDPFLYLNHYSNMAMNDVRKNKYLLKYLLSNEEYVCSMKNFEFIGSPEERIKLLKSDLKKLEE